MSSCLATKDTMQSRTIEKDHDRIIYYIYKNYIQLHVTTYRHYFRIILTLQFLPLG